MRTAGMGLTNRELDKLVGMAGESMGVDGWRSMRADGRVRGEADRFEAAAWSMLERWARSNPEALAEGVDAGKLWDEDGAWLILMTLRGEGVGIWDGTWDRMFSDRSKIKELERYLKSGLSKYADGTGGGSLDEAISDRAMSYDMAKAASSRTAGSRYVKIAARITADSRENLELLAEAAKEAGRVPGVTDVSLGDSEWDGSEGVFEVALQVREWAGEGYPGPKMPVSFVVDPKSVARKVADKVKALGLKVLSIELPKAVSGFLGKFKGWDMEMVRVEVGVPA